MLARLIVQCAGGLVAEEQLGVFRKRPGDRHALLFAARELRGEILRPLGQAHLPQHLPGRKRIPAQTGGKLHVFDCSTFTVNGEHLTSYKADVDDMGDYVPETQVIKHEGDKYFFDESALRSAPYFDINIDGITKLG